MTSPRPSTRSSSQGGPQLLQLGVEILAALRDLVAPFDGAARDDDVPLDDAQRLAG
jgi:hypothetical protein